MLRCEVLLLYCVLVGLLYPAAGRAAGGGFAHICLSSPTVTPTTPPLNCAVAQEAAGSDETTVLDAVLAVDPEGAALDKWVAAVWLLVDSAVLCFSAGGVGACRLACSLDLNEKASPNPLPTPTFHQPTHSTHSSHRQIAELEAAVDSGDARIITAAVAAAHAGRAAAAADAAAKIAAHRSGLRGLQARRVAIDTQDKARAAKATADAAAARAKRGNGSGEDGDDYDDNDDDGGEEQQEQEDREGEEGGSDVEDEGAATPPLEEAEESAHSLLNELYERQADADPEAARARAAQILAGLGFGAERQVRGPGFVGMRGWLGVGAAE